MFFFQQMFMNEQRINQVNQYLMDMGKISAAYVSHGGDSSLTDAFNQATNQWEGTQQKAEAVRLQLQNVPDLWSTYHLK